MKIVFTLIVLAIYAVSIKCFVSIYKNIKNIPNHSFWGGRYIEMFTEYKDYKNTTAKYKCDFYFSNIHNGRIDFARFVVGFIIGFSMLLSIIFSCFFPSKPTDYVLENNPTSKVTDYQLQYNKDGTLKHNSDGSLDIKYYTEYGTSKYYAKTWGQVFSSGFGFFGYILLPSIIISTSCIWLWAEKKRANRLWEEMDYADIMWKEEENKKKLEAEEKKKAEKKKKLEWENSEDGIKSKLNYVMNIMEKICGNEIEIIYNNHAYNKLSYIYANNFNFFDVIKEFNFSECKDWSEEDKQKFIELRIEYIELIKKRILIKNIIQDKRKEDKQKINELKDMYFELTKNIDDLNKYLQKNLSVEAEQLLAVLPVGVENAMTTDELNIKIRKMKMNTYYTDLDIIRAVSDMKRSDIDVKSVKVYRSLKPFTGFYLEKEFKF